MPDNIDALLDSTLDELDDLPTFEPFPPGVHKVSATLNLKEVNDKQCVTLDLVGIETVELSDPSSDEPLKAGDVCNVLFMLDNEYGRGNLKKVCTPLGEALGTGVIREVIEQTNDMECLILTSIRIDKNDKDRTYLNIKELNVV